MCPECYIDDNIATPLLNPLDCLTSHTQYICGTCGRCNCVERDPKRELQRWNFPFKSLDIAKMYLRTADFTMKQPCGIYEIESENGRHSYMIFSNIKDLNLYLNENNDKICRDMKPVYMVERYMDYPHTKVRKLSDIEICCYMIVR